MHHLATPMLPDMFWPVFYMHIIYLTPTKMLFPHCCQFSRLKLCPRLSWYSMNSSSSLFLFPPSTYSVTDHFAGGGHSPVNILPYMSSSRLDHFPNFCSSYFFWP